MRACTATFRIDDAFYSCVLFACVCAALIPTMLLLLMLILFRPSSAGNHFISTQVLKFHRNESNDYRFVHYLFVCLFGDVVVGVVVLPLLSRCQQAKGIHQVPVLSFFFALCISFGQTSLMLMLVLLVFRNKWQLDGNRRDNTRLNVSKVPQRIQQNELLSPVPFSAI